MATSVKHGALCSHLSFFVVKGVLVRITPVLVVVPAIVTSLDLLTYITLILCFLVAENFPVR